MLIRVEASCLAMVELRRSCSRVDQSRMGVRVGEGAFKRRGGGPGARGGRGGSGQLVHLVVVLREVHHGRVLLRHVRWTVARRRSMRG